MAKSNAAPGWGRPDLTVKLSKRRLEQMKKIAEGLPDSATPTDAIDHALAAALASSPANDRLNDIEDAIERWGMEQRFEVARIEAAIAALAKGVEALHALISAVSQSEDY
jgi:hypothetical protein